MLTRREIGIKVYLEWKEDLPGNRRINFEFREIKQLGGMCQGIVTI